MQYSFVGLNPKIPDYNKQFASYYREQTAAYWQLRSYKNIEDIVHLLNQKVKIKYTWLINR